MQKLKFMCSSRGGVQAQIRDGAKTGGSDDNYRHQQA